MKTKEIARRLAREVGAWQAELFQDNSQVTTSIRWSAGDVAKLDILATQAGVSRSALLRQLVRDAYDRSPRQGVSPHAAKFWRQCADPEFAEALLESPVFSAVGDAIITMPQDAVRRLLSTYFNFADPRELTACI